MPAVVLGMGVPAPHNTSRPPPLQHPPLARSPCAEPLLDRLPYRSADLEHPRSKFVARPEVTLAVEAHYVLEGAGEIMPR